MADLTIRKDINLLNITRTTTSTTYTSTADREPLWRYTAANYSDVDAIYLEGTMRAAAADNAYMILTSVAGTDVTGSEITTNSTTNVTVVSGDIKANLVDGTDYRFRWKSGAGGSAAFDTASISIHQSGAVTATATVIEIGEDNNVPSTSYAAPTDYAVWKYEAARFDGTVAVYLEADLHNNGSGDTTYAALYDLTAAAQVTGSEVSHTGDTTTTLKRSGDILANLVDGHEYRADIKGTSTSDDVPAVKIRIHQSGTPTKTDGYIPILNTLTSGTTTTYTYQNRFMTFNAAEFAGDTVVFKYEATLKTTGNTAYYNLNNDTDAVELAVVTTTSTSYARVRDDTVTMPVDAGNVLNSGRKIDTSGTTTVGRSFLIVQIDWSVGGVTRIIRNLTLLGVGN